MKEKQPENGKTRKNNQKELVPQITFEIQIRPLTPAQKAAGQRFWTKLIHRSLDKMNGE